jgi:hypothetical protein
MADAAVLRLAGDTDSMPLVAHLEIGAVARFMDWEAFAYWARLALGSLTSQRSQAGGSRAGRRPQTTQPTVRFHPY